MILRDEFSHLKSHSSHWCTNFFKIIFRHYFKSFNVFLVYHKNRCVRFLRLIQVSIKIATMFVIQHLFYIPVAINVLITPRLSGADISVRNKLVPYFYYAYKFSYIYFPLHVVLCRTILHTAHLCFCVVKWHFNGALALQLN